MKKFYFLLGMCVALASCEKTTELQMVEIPDTFVGFVNNGTDAAIGALPNQILIVKFQNDADKDYVVGVNPITDYDEYQNISLDKSIVGLQLMPEPYYVEWTIGCFGTTSTPLSKFAEQVLSICGTSPYVELCDGYYMIDWPWVDFFSPGFRDGYPDLHGYLTPTRWDELDSLSTTWKPKEVKILNLSELHCSTYKWLDIYRGTPDSDVFFGPQNGSLYYRGGLRAWTAYCKYMEYPYAGIEKWPYEKFVHYADSMTQVYKECLIEVIHNNDLNNVAQSYVAESLVSR